MRRLQNCDEQLVEPESGWDGVCAFQGRCVTLPPFETRVDENWEQGGVRLKGRECPEHSLYRSLNRLRTLTVRQSLSLSGKVMAASASMMSIDQEQFTTKGSKGHCERSRWRQGQVPLKVVKYIYIIVLSIKAHNGNILKSFYQGTRTDFSLWLYSV